MHLHLFFHAGAALPVVYEVAVGLTLATPHPPTQLVQLCKPKALCTCERRRAAEWVSGMGQLGMFTSGQHDLPTSGLKQVPAHMASHTGATSWHLTCMLNDHHSGMRHIHSHLDHGGAAHKPARPM